MHPLTYLMTAPDAARGTGRSMSFADLKRGLERANRRIVIPSPRDFHFSTGFTGLTAIFLGPPRQPGSRQITSVRAGMIPEYTIIRPDGTIQAKGWRAILEKCITAKVATRSRFETIFRIDLSVDRESLGKWCARCLRGGNWCAATSGPLCDMHREIDQQQAEIATMQQVMRERFPATARALDALAEKEHDDGAREV